MKNKIKHIILILFCCAWGHLSHAQQLDKIGTKDWITSSGSLNINQVYRPDYGQSTQPYSLVASGSISTSVLGVSLPLQFTWSNNDWTYTQPFNRITLAPSYKWVRTSIGRSSTSFSPYSLSGHQYTGLGVELSPPGKFKVSLMGGQLLKRSEGNAEMGIRPNYERLGGGFKVEYNLEKGNVGVHAFYAKDKEETPFEKADSLQLHPQENLVLGFLGRYAVLPSVNISWEVATSHLMYNTHYGSLFKDKPSIKYAGKGSISWTSFLGSLGGTYEMVEPNYATLGSYYNNNNFENYTLDYATALFQGKVTLAVNTGIRKTNIDDSDEQTVEDNITSLNLGFSPNQRLNLNASYSNFRNYTYVESAFREEEADVDYILGDTIRYTSINETVQLSSSYQLSTSKDVSQSITANAMVQLADQEQSDAEENAGTEFYNYSAGYSYQHKKQFIGMSLNYNYSINKMQTGEAVSQGPVFSFRKGLFENKMKTNLGAVWNQSYTDGEKQSETITLRCGASVSIVKKHNINFSGVAAFRNREDAEDTHQTTLSLGYSYRFGITKKKDKPENM